MSHYDHAVMIALGLDPRITPPPLGRDGAGGGGSLPYRPRWPFWRRLARLVRPGLAKCAASATPAARRAQTGATREPADAAAPGLS